MLLEDKPFNTSADSHLDIKSVSFPYAVSWQVTMVPSLPMGKQAVVRHSPSQVEQNATVTEALSQGHCRTFLNNYKRYEALTSFSV